MLTACLAAAPATQSDTAHREAATREAAPTTAAGDRPITLTEAKARETLRTATEFAGLPVLHPKTIGEVLKLTLNDNELLLDTALKPVEQAAVQLPDLPGLARVKFLGAVEQSKPVVIVQFDLEIRDYTVPNAIASHTSASLVAGTLQLTQLWETIDDETYSVQLLQRPVTEGDDTPHVSLFVQDTGATPPVDLQYKAANVTELRRAHPSEVAKYVDPIFRALHQDALLSRVDSKLAWQVFAETFTPSEDLMSQVKAVVTRLDAESFQEREAASRDLDKLGQPAALVLAKQDRKGWSDEQATRIDSFLAGFRIAADDDVKKLRGDKDFLIDCLGSSHIEIRKLAFDQLQKLTGKTLAIDVNADPQSQQRALDQIRQSVGTPTTHQAKE